MIFLYRKNGGQVLGVSVDAAAYDSVDATYFATVVDPPVPDGANIGVPKIFDGSQVRNATGGEQTAFLGAKSVDDNLAARQSAKDTINVNPAMRKILGGIVSVLLDEINIVRTQPTTVFAARTMAQAKAAIMSKIDGGAVD